MWWVFAAVSSKHSHYDFIGERERYQKKNGGNVKASVLSLNAWEMMFRRLMLFLVYYTHWRYIIHLMKLVTIDVSTFWGWSFYSLVSPSQIHANVIDELQSLQLFKTIQNNNNNSNEQEKKKTGARQNIHLNAFGKHKKLNILLINLWLSI